MYTCKIGEKGNMGKGRKPISNELKMLRGTDQPSRMVKQSDMTKVLQIPKSGLKGTAKKIFEVVACELINKKLLEFVGMDLVIAYSSEMALYYDMTKEVEKEGYVIEVISKKGITKIVNPKRKIAETALSNAKSLASEFGFTPASRSKVSSLISDDKINDDFAEFEELRNDDK